MTRINAPLRRALVAAAGITLALVAIAPNASAQFGRRQRGGNEGGANDPGIAGPPPIPEHVAALVLEHAGELALADSQRTLIESVRRAQDSANHPWLAKLDSLRPTSRPANGPDDLSQEQRDEIATRRAHVNEVMDQMRETNAQARIKVMAALNPDQQKQAAKLEDDARKRAEDEGRRRGQSGNLGGQERRRGGGGMGRPPVI